MLNRFVRRDHLCFASIVFFTICVLFTFSFSAKFNSTAIPTTGSASELIQSDQYTPDWSSLDARPLPAWYDQVKLGIFIHWGVFSVPSFGSEWFWWNWQGLHNPTFTDFMARVQKPNFAYADFGPLFTAEFFNASEWASLFKQSGAKYVVLTSKHHDGFAMWPSNYSWNWNAGTVGPKRDLVGELSTAVKKEQLHFGLYHSMYEWFHPLYMNDRSNNFTTNFFVQNKVYPEMIELVNKYSPEVFWSDGDWEASEDYWQSKQFLAWLYNHSPVKTSVAVNDRWGLNTYCHHGGFYNCLDRFSPGKLLDHKWENAMTLDKSSWGFSRTSQLSNYLSIKELLSELIQTVSCGGNLLVNIGPTHDGRIPIIFQERLTQLGQWLAVNGEAIYSTKPYSIQNDTLTGSAWYTQSQNTNIWYCAFTDWPEDHVLKLSIVNQIKSTTRIELLAKDQPKQLKFTKSDNQLQVQLDPKVLIESQSAWAIRFTN